MRQHRLGAWPVRNLRIRGFIAESKLLRRCPRTGRIVGVEWQGAHIALLPLVALLALAWYLARVLPKPSRATYPCTQAAGSVLSGLLVYAAGAAVSGGLVRRGQRLLRGKRYANGIAAIAVAGVVFAVGMVRSAAIVRAGDPDEGTKIAQLVPDASNAPVGVAKGIMPGRVAWAHDPNAAHWDGKTGHWWDAASNNQTLVNEMLGNVVMSVANQSTVAKAWNALFLASNTTRGRGSVGYTAGETIAIKVNLNNNGSQTGTSNNIDASPQMAYALLDELVNQAGVTGASITFYDNMRAASSFTAIKNYVTAFPGVNFVGSDTSNPVANSITFSGGGIGTTGTGFPKALVNATYMINMALLKRHTSQDAANGWDTEYGNTGVTLCGKNNCGTSNNCGALHYELRDWNQPGASYNPLVDMMASSKVGGKVVLFLLDGLYTGNRYDSGPQQWQMAPFNGSWPSSVFGSQDPVAIDSVGIDFLSSEWWVAARANNYLHEAASIGNAPSGTVYKPDGTPVTGSLGVTEHWNNATAKQYSRNLDPVNGKGIELVQIGPGGGQSDGGTLDGGAATAGDATMLADSGTPAVDATTAADASGNTREDAAAAAEAGTAKGDATTLADALSGATSDSAGGMVQDAKEWADATGSAIDGSGTIGGQRRGFPRQRSFGERWRRARDDR